MKKVVLFIILIFLLPSFYFSYNRFRIEERNKKVELCLDFESLKHLADFEGIEITEILNKFKKTGISSVAVYEDTLYELNEEGKLKYSPIYNGVSIHTYDINLLNQIYQNFKFKWGNKRLKLYPDTLAVYGEKKYIENLGLGINTQEINSVKGLNLSVIPRLKNYAKLSDKSLDFQLSSISENSTIIFDGEEVLGYERLVNLVAKKFKEKKLNFGFVEFAKQKGEEKLGEKMLPNVIRVHSIQEEEMKKIKDDELVERMVRAVCERNIRICYLRLFAPAAGINNKRRNLEFIKKLKNKLQSKGFVLGKAHNFSYFSFPLPIPKMLRKMFALLAAILFPVFSVLIVQKRKKRENFLKESLIRFLISSIVSIFGGFLIVGLLYDLRFLIKVDQFSGIKIAFVFPLFIVFLIYFKDKLKEFLNEPLKIYQAGICLVLGGVLLLLLTRSGNEPIFQVSQLEMKFRSLLEKLLIYRPRTKEFLVGHPLLILAYFLQIRNNKIYLSLLLIGLIGQISIINTFCHIHTPLLFSILRSFNGVILGLFLGIFLIYLYKFLEKFLWKKN